MGPNVEFIITQSVMQCNKEGPDMAAINSLGGQYSTTYWGGGGGAYVFCHRQSGEV